MDGFFLIGYLLALAIAIWLYFVVPAQMAQARNRSRLIWVLISLVGSPLLAILLLYALGEARENGLDQSLKY
ncbi:hypothetical protein [uncultured Roseobacter sp.]|uniref:hypothetical protein n=1 Tax=uncultured Roseobacter sp. TaxID=114847 RepID=UPI00262CFFD0|nr:hypothetical protein [uncultured Roseobacter sp.]